MHKIQAYFETENAAESVKARLQALTIEKESVEKVPKDTNEISQILKEVFSPKSQEEDFRPYVLNFEVTADDYVEANKIVMDHSGYISKQ